MKRFLIHVDTNWCGEDQDIAEEEGYDPDEMTDEECEDDEEWNEYSGEYLWEGQLI